MLFENLSGKECFSLICDKTIFYQSQTELKIIQFSQTTKDSDERAKILKKNPSKIASV